MAADPVVSPADTPESEFQPDDLKSGGQISGEPAVSPADTIRQFIRYHSRPGNADHFPVEVALDALLAVGERDKADAGTAAGRMRAVWAWIHEEGKGREDVLAELCPGWSIVSSRVAVEEALMVAFDRLVEERGERDRQHIARLTEALERIADLGCHVRYGGRRRDWTCLDQQRDAIERPEGYTNNYYWWALKAGDRLCDACRARSVLAGEEDAEPERQVAEGYATGMRESRPNVCWRLLDGGDWCCILDRGHDGGIHEPGRAAGEEDAGGGGSQTCVCESGTRDTDTSGTVADTSPSARAAGGGDT